MRIIHVKQIEAPCMQGASIVLMNVTLLPQGNS